MENSNKKHYCIQVIKKIRVISINITDNEILADDIKQIGVT